MMEKNTIMYFAFLAASTFLNKIMTMEAGGRFKPPALRK